MCVIQYKALLRLLSNAFVFAESRPELQGSSGLPAKPRRPAAAARGASERRDGSGVRPPKVIL